MSIYINKDTKVITQGITGKTGQFHTLGCQAYANGKNAFVAGVNPHRTLDDDYRGFLSLLIGQLSASLTDAKTYEEERARLEALAELDRAKTTFFSNVSHELRTPLTLMLGPIEDVLKHVDGEAREQLDIAHRNSVRLLKLVNSLLDFSRIEAGRMQATFQPTELARFTTELASVFRSAIERAGLRFDVKLNAPTRPVYVDGEMWEKIVLNLLSNAFKYTLTGAIEVTLNEHGDHVELSVRDSGVGIPEHEIGQLFQRFHRVEGTRGRTQEGTGIGLALVSELVKMHGGSIGVTSEMGRGSTFTVKLPFGFEHLPQDRVRQTAAAMSTIADAYVEEAMRWLPGAATSDEAPLEQGAALGSQFAQTRGSRIILAEDNQDMQQYVARLLRPFWQVEVVPDGQAALEAARRERPNLVLSDVMMPRLDGFGLLQALRADRALADIPIILLSARAGEESRVEGMTAGADDYLVKPFSGRELLARVGAHLELSRVRRDAANALAGAQQRIEAALLAGEVGTYHWDITNDRISGDRNFVPIFGVALDEDGVAPIGDFLRVIHADDRDRVTKLIQATLATDAPFETEYRIDNPRTGVRWAIVRGRVERDASGKPASWDGVVVDITERKLAEQRLLEVERTARVEAERVGRMKDEFLATLSHELRTPLNAMLGWTQILRHRRQPDDLDEGLSVIERNARTQAQLIEDLLDMSRIISGKIRLDVQPVALADVLTAAMDVVRPAAEAKGVRLVQTIDPHAGPVSGDANRLQQILWNLLSNAVKFTPRDGRVHLVLERVNSHLEISVADSGQGISPEFLPFVFERFRQEDGSTQRLHGGLGLGLAIVKHLVELHGGQVRAKSAGLGKGATFIVSLPLAPLKRNHDEHAEHPAVRVERERIEDAPRLDGVKILVVDDDRDARDILRRMLEDCGARVVVAASAAEALAALPKELPDLLLSDIGMPEMDGYELIRRVRQLETTEGGRVPAVAITAFARSEDRRRALMSGYQMHIAKPFEPDELRAVCASLAPGGVRNRA